MEHFGYNATVALTTTFTNPNTGLNVNPGTVTFRVKKPNGSTLTFVTGGGTPPSNPSLGVFRVEFPLDQVGVWEWDCDGRDISVEAVLPQREFMVDDFAG